TTDRGCAFLFVLCWSRRCPHAGKNKGGPGHPRILTTLGTARSFLVGAVLVATAPGDVRPLGRASNRTLPPAARCRRTSDRRAHKPNIGRCQFCPSPGPVQWCHHRAIVPPRRHALQYP